MEIGKEKKYRKIVRWLLIDLAVTCVILALLLYKPRGYDRNSFAPAASKRGQVPSYLTYLSSELYNNAQKGQPFELVVVEDSVNETISQSNLPLEADGVRFSAPAVLFVPQRAVFMGAANIKGAEFIVTIELEPKVDQRGLLNLEVAKIKIGAMNITPLAKIIAKKMYQKRLETVPIDVEDIRTKIAASLLNDEPFEPVFKIEDKRVRLEKIIITKGKLILRMVPA